MIDDHRRALAHAAARRLADLLAEPRHETSPLPWREQSLAKGAAGVAILHGVLASHGHGGHGDARRAHAWLARAAREQLSAGPGVGLWFGVPAVAFAILAAAPHDYRRAAADLDSAVRDVVRVRLAAANARLGAGVRPLLAEFDLVHGLTGLGAYLLRRDPHGQQLRHVLAHLVRLTQPVPVDDQAGSTAPGWWARDAPSPHQTERYPGGHANFGMAHGITGPLALLALAMRRASRSRATPPPSRRSAGGSTPGNTSLQPDHGGQSTSESPNSAPGGPSTPDRPGPRGATAPRASPAPNSWLASRCATPTANAPPNTPSTGA
jgi:hypothetical protein